MREYTYLSADEQLFGVQMGQVLEFDGDKRRKHRHFLVTITYTDGVQFGRAYTDSSKAQKFADRQKKSPAVKSVQVRKTS